MKTNFSTQPFLTSLEQAAEQTVNYLDFEALLKEQQSHFKENVEECFFLTYRHPNVFIFFPMLITPYVVSVGNLPIKSEQSTLIFFVFGQC